MAVVLHQAAAPTHPPHPAGNSLNAKYTFDTFVIGASNRFAHAAALAIAEAPARAYNPLFIWGESGLGKTHLLHAAGQLRAAAVPRHAGQVRLHRGIHQRLHQLPARRPQGSFKRRYRDTDVLLVDDIQFIEGKDGIQEEFFHTFNTLHNANKQIVISSDRPPKQLATLEDRLRTRFEWGLITDVQPPELETRIAILRKKAQMDRLDVPDDVLELIASRIERNIRELEGALIRVTAFASLNKTPIDRSLAEIVLRDLISDSSTHADQRRRPSWRSPPSTSTPSVEELRGPGKTRALAQSRQIAMYLCRELTDLPCRRSARHSAVTTPRSCTRRRRSATKWPSAVRSSITSRNSPRGSDSAPSADTSASSQHCATLEKPLVRRRVSFKHSRVTVVPLVHSTGLAPTVCTNLRSTVNVTAASPARVSEPSRSSPHGIHSRCTPRRYPLASGEPQLVPSCTGPITVWSLLSIDFLLKTGPGDTLNRSWARRLSPPGVSRNRLAFKLAPEALRLLLRLPFRSSSSASLAVADASGKPLVDAVVGVCIEGTHGRGDDDGWADRLEVSVVREDFADAVAWVARNLPSRPTVPCWPACC